MALRELAAQLDVDAASLGLPPAARRRREAAEAAVAAQRRRWLRLRLLYGAAAALLESDALCASSARPGSDLRLRARLNRRWFAAHASRGAGDSPADADDPAGAELAAAAREPLRRALRRRLDAARAAAGLAEGPADSLASRVAERARLAATLGAEEQRTLGRARRALLSGARLAAGLSADARELFDGRRRLLRPRLDLVTLRLHAEELRAVGAKLGRLAWEARTRLWTPDRARLARDASARIAADEQRWREEVADLERALSRYRAGDDAEFGAIVRQVDECQSQLANRARVLQRLEGEEEGERKASV